MAEPNQRSNYAKWLAQGVVILAGVSFAAALGSNWLLYQAAYQEEAGRLTELAKTQAILIDTVAEAGLMAREDVPQRAGLENDFAVIQKAHAQYPGFGETGEFTLGTLREGYIVFLLSHRHFDFADPVPIPWDSPLGEPMRRALQGKSGVFVGLDYRGETVLAAHEPLPRLKAGIVAKIDLAEVRKPFIRAGLIGMIGVGIMVVIGALLFRHISIPLVERERTIDRLRILTQVVEQSPNLVFITNTEGVIEYVNPRFTEVTGYTREEAVGKTPRILKSGEIGADFYKKMWKTLKGGNVWRCEIKDQRKDGSSFWASMVAAPVKDDTGQINHFVAIHEDITEKKMAETQVGLARLQAETANRAKSELLANMSHELRTPLNAILGFSEMMREAIFGPLNDKYSEYADLIHGSGSHLLEIINDILDVAAIEAGKVTLSNQDMSLLEACQTALRIISPKADKGQVKIVFSAAEDLPEVVADRRRLIQVFLNLLSNAVKFTPPGGTVRFDVALAETGGPVITISDTGIGMDDAGLALAVTQFGQVDSSLARKHEGTGLGLPLTKGLVELHDGTMTLTSQLGVGTTVTITLPAGRVRARQSA